MSDEVLIFGLDDSELDDYRIFGIKSRDATYARDAVSASTLKSHLESFVSSMKDVLTAVPKAMGNYQVDEISFTVQVSAQGTVSLFGMAGAEIGGSGGITITLKHKESGNQQDKEAGQPAS